MKVVQFEDVTPVRGLEHRAGPFHSRPTAGGEPGTVGNFKFSLSELGTDYSGPRHRHNFDQYRYMLSGESDYGQDGPLKAGMLGYYPEGVPYGPQVNKTGIVCAVLQFGGASGGGYLQPREVKAGMEEVKAVGEVRDGVFHRRRSVQGKRNMDAYQAIWEHVHGREMTYPKGRYDAPIAMDAANYQWAPIRGAAGAAENLFAVFTERRTQPRLVKLSAGAAYEVAGRGVYLVLSGAGEADGMPLQKFTTIFLEADERTTLRASAATELLHYGLPDLSDLEIGYHSAAVQAAE